MKEKTINGCQGVKIVLAGGYEIIYELLVCQGHFSFI